MTPNLQMMSPQWAVWSFVCPPKMGCARGSSRGYRCESVHGRIGLWAQGRRAVARLWTQIHELRIITFAQNANST